LERLSSFNVITATTFVVQIVGPICVKFAISRAGKIERASLEHNPRPRKSWPRMQKGGTW